jgi:hypothetical protein
MIPKESRWNLALGATAGLLEGILASILQTGHGVRAQESAENASDVVRAREFQLVDQAGHPLALLAFSATGRPHLAMLNHSNTQIVWLGISDDSGLAVHDVDGKTRLILSLDQSGKPSLVMRDRPHRIRSLSPE